MASSINNSSHLTTSSYHRRRVSASSNLPLKSQNMSRSSDRTSRRRSSSSSAASSQEIRQSASADSLVWSGSSSEADWPLTPTTTQGTDAQRDRAKSAVDVARDVAGIDLTKSHDRRASTTLLTQDPEDIQSTVGVVETGTQLIQKYCCGGGCCFLNPPPTIPASTAFSPIELPDNEAFRSLNINLNNISSDIQLSNVADLPEITVQLENVPKSEPKAWQSLNYHPPEFVKPHPPYDVFSAPLHHARELTKPGAEKRTFHLDIDVTDYPEEAGVDFKVGGAIGVTPPNPPEAVEEIFNVLGIPSFVRDKPVLLRTSGGRWPTIWGDEEARELRTTRRQLLTWCSDVQSYPPTKGFLRLLAEHATAENEKTVLMFLSSFEGQPAFCDLRTGSHLSVAQILHAFPSSKPPLNEVLSVLGQLMPRFYSLSNDPHISSSREGLANRRLIEIAVTVAEEKDWKGNTRQGVGSGFLERIAKQYIEAERRGEMSAGRSTLRIPMFRGLMANPLSKEFGVSDGPMMLIGAGVGMAPFRGFILNRLRNANCASKIWLVQGVRNSDLDELYSGELGSYEQQIKRVVQSRAASTNASPSRQPREPRQPRGQSNLAPSASDSGSSDTDDDASPPSSQTSDSGFDGDRDPATEPVVSIAAAAPVPTAPAGAQWKVDARAESRYVQDEVRHQADVVWNVINSIDGRVFVCGSSKGMGEGVEQALREVALEKGNFADLDGAKHFWEEMAEAGKYIKETW